MVIAAFGLQTITTVCGTHKNRTTQLGPGYIISFTYRAKQRGLSMDKAHALLV